MRTFLIFLMAVIPAFGQYAPPSGGGGTGTITLSGDATGSGSGTVAVTVGAIGGHAITLGGTVTLSGAYAFAGTLTGATTVTFPTSGTLLSTASSAGSFPTLNQNTTGSAAGVGSGTYLPYLTAGVPAQATSSQVQSVIGPGVYDASGAATGLLSSSNTWSGTNNFTGTFKAGGNTYTFPATSGTIATLNTANAFTATQQAPGFALAQGPLGIFCVCAGDSRMQGGQADTTQDYNLRTYYISSIPSNLQNNGFFSTAIVDNFGQSGTGLQNGINCYYGTNQVGPLTATCTHNTNSFTVTSNTGLAVSQGVGGPGIAPETYIASITGSGPYTINLASVVLPPGTFCFTGTTGTESVYFANPQGTILLGQGRVSTLHLLSPAVNGLTNSVIIDQWGVNDAQTLPLSCTVNGTTAVTFGTAYPSLMPYVGETISSTHFPGGTTTITAVTPTGFTASTAATGSATETITITPNAAAWLTDLSGLVTIERADGYNVIVVTPPKAYVTTIGGNTYTDSIRAAMVTGEVAAYANGAVSGVALCDMADAPAFATENANIYYTDNLHFTTYGYGISASIINATATSFFSSLIGSYQQNQLYNAQAAADALYGTRLNIGDGVSVVSLTIKGDSGASGNSEILMGGGGVKYSTAGGGSYQLFNGGSYAAITGVASITPTAGSGMVGGTSATLPASGVVGEQQLNSIPVGSAVSLTSATPANICSKSLTAGHWQVFFNANTSSSAATMVATAPLTSGISTTSSTLPTDGTEGYTGINMTVAGSINSIQCSPIFVNVTTTRTVYGVVQATFTAGTVMAWGSMQCVRIQ